MLDVIRTGRPLPGANADENADLPTRPLVGHRLFEDQRSRIIFSGAFVDEDTLANFDGLERETGRGSGPSCFPDGAVGLSEGLLAGVIRAKKDCGAILRRALEDSGNSPDGSQYQMSGPWKGSGITYVFVRFSRSS